MTVASPIPEHQPTLEPERQLAEDMGKFWDKPYEWVMYAYPWGQPGPLQHFDGPFDWQKQFLLRLGREIRKRGFDGRNSVRPIRMACASGHGVGKSALTAWLVGFIMATRPGAKGMVTAATASQLETKTWAEVNKFNSRSIVGHWFEVTTGRGSMKMVRRGSSEDWRVDAITCRKENSEAFAGQHSVQSTSFYILDESSGVPFEIFSTAEGGLTDGEPMFFSFGNPLRTTGRFFQFFHRLKHRWVLFRVDSREVPITNKQYLNEQIQDWGIDSDWVRSRILGLFPRASDVQLIPFDIVEAARDRPEVSLPDDPLVMGVDVARGGEDRSVIAWRRGFSARSVKHGGCCPNMITMRGDETRDTMRLVSVVIEQARQHSPDAIFVDSTGVGGPIADRLRELGFPCYDVVYSGSSPDPQCYNVRSYIWKQMRDWLRAGGCIDNDEALESDLCGPEYGHRQDKLLLESKEQMKDRDVESPDLGDALANTFAIWVPPKSLDLDDGIPVIGRNYDPLEVRR